jgi:nitrilase
VDITRFIALEGRCYVLSAGTILRAGNIPADFPARDASLHSDDEVLFDGGSAVASPDGSWIAEPVAGEERLVTAEIDLQRVRGERQNFDPAGHYFRGDVIKVEIDRRRLDPVEFHD